LAWLVDLGTHYPRSRAVNTGRDLSNFPARNRRKGKERNGTEEYLYSATLVRTHTLKALRRGSHSFTCKFTPSLPFLRKHSPDGATHNWGSRHRIAAYYSFIDPEGMKGWVGLVGWPIADGLPT